MRHAAITNIRYYFFRRTLLANSQEHKAGYEWTLAHLRLGYTPVRCMGTIKHPFDHGVDDAVRDFGRAHHENPTMVYENARRKV